MYYVNYITVLLKPLFLQMVVKVWMTYLENHVGTLTKHSIIRRVNWRLLCEFAIKQGGIIIAR